MRAWLEGIVLLIACIFVSSVDVQAAPDSSVRSRIKIRKKSHMATVTPDESEEYSLEKMEVLNKKRKNLVEDIKRFIREATSEDQKGELNLRLGGLYMEDYYAQLARAQQVFEMQTKLYTEENAGKKGKKKKAPVLDNSEAIASLDKARAVYRDLIKRYPQHRRRDEMLYFMALSSMDKGLTTEGMSYFKALSEQTPNSRYVNDSLVQLGDHYFDTNKFQIAETYYDKVIARKHTPLMPYSIYKKAWCEYNTQRTAQALSHFKWVIQNEVVQEGAGPQIRIKNEALRDITLPFVDLKQVQESIAFFRTQGDQHFRRGVETMATLYFEQGDYPSSIIMNETLLKMDANHAKNPSYEISIVEALKLRNQDSEAVARLFSRFPLYLENSNWYEIHSAKPAVIQEAQKLFEETARKYAFQYHAEGQKTKNEKLYEVAKALYSKYLEYFPRTPYAAQVRFYLAEILYKQQVYVAAADHYFKVYKDPAAGNLKVDSIRYALSALDRQLNIDRKKAGLNEITTKSTSKLKEKEDEVLQLIPYSPVETTFFEISEIYLENYPTAKDAPDVLYENAYLQYSHFDLLKAYKGFWTMVQKYPKHETVYSSSYLILDILNRKKDYKNLIAACKKFLETPSLNKATFKTEVASVLRSAELKRIQLVEEKGEYKEAAEGYIEYTKAYGVQDEALFEKALYNASVNFTKANLFLPAVETQEKFLRRFPKSPLRENMLLQVAKTYEMLAMFDKSAHYYELFTTTYPNNGQAKAAWRLAGIYYWGSGNSAKAEQTMLSYIRSYPKDAQQVERDLLDLYESAGAKGKLIGFYITKRAQKGVPHSDYVALSVKIAELQAEAGGKTPVAMMDEALRVSQRSFKDITSTPKGVEAVSKLLFWYASRKEHAFHNLKLTLPQRQLEANLSRKLALLKELEQEYTRIVQLGAAEWGLASIYKTALVYRSLAQDVNQAPVPSELTAEQVELYRAEVQKQMIRPFNEKALALAVSCLDKSQEFNLLAPWTSRCYSLAGELQPERYPNVRTFYLPALQLAVFLPPKNPEPKIEVGSVKRYAYPYFSAGLFNPPIEKTGDDNSDVPALYDISPGLSEGPGAVPNMTTYRHLAEVRTGILKGTVESEKPADYRRGGSFAYLNALRLTNPQRAIPSILEAIQRDPQDSALHNLLGLAYVEMGNLPAAKVTWYSLVARGVKTSQIWNNLGVVANMEGHEEAAIAYFNEAKVLENPKEALTNLGFIALKYRNGFEAKGQFEKAIQIDSEDVTAQLGLAVAKIQNREMDAAKDNLIELAKKYKNDPFARLSLGYFLIDVEKENGLARKILSEFMDRQSVENDFQFRQAIQEARDIAGDAGSLPSIDQ